MLHAARRCKSVTVQPCTPSACGQTPTVRPQPCSGPGKAARARPVAQGNDNPGKSPKNGQRRKPVILMPSA
eukprot:11025826-Alexandrium_andersonii.AAC.1